MALGVTACGDDDDDDDGGGGGGAKATGKTLTIYSSWPLQGGAQGQGEAMRDGAKLALKKRGGKAGDFKIRYKALDDALASTGAADEGKGAQNARTAVRDKTGIAFLAAYNSGIAKVEIPITNKAGMLQVSPANTYVGLTTDKPGSEPGEPEKYYPAKTRTYARVVPVDTVQGAALVSAAQEAGCKSAHLFNSKTTYSAGLNRNIALTAKEKGLEITGDDGIDIKAPNYRSLVAKVEADCIISSAEHENNGSQLIKDAGTVHKDAKLFESDGFVLAASANPKTGVPANIAPRVKATFPPLGFESLPQGKQFLDDFEAEFGRRDPDPYAAYGFEAMDLVLDSIEEAGAKGNDRAAVREAAFSGKERGSVLGKFTIDKNGDTTLTNYGLYKIENGKWAFEKVLKGEG